MKISFALLFFLLGLQANSFCQATQLTAYKAYFDNDLKAWSQSFKNFQLSKLKFSDSLTFENIPFGDTKDIHQFYELYKPALAFSNDSSQFIDIYSYWLNLEKKGNKIIANSEVDQAVSLCHLKSNKWTRIFFCGLSTRIDEVAWLSDTKFILAGTLLDDTGVFHPEVLIGDITKQKLFVYTDRSTVSTKAGYSSIKLKKLNLQTE